MLELDAEFLARCGGPSLESSRLFFHADFVCGNASEAAQNGRLSFSAADARACVEALAVVAANVDCVEATGESDPLGTDPCTAALQGTVPLGGACLSFHFIEFFDECAGNTFCDQGGAESCMGTCAAYLGEGETCDILDGSLRCDSDHTCSHDTCMAEAALDAPCEGPEAASCGNGLYCEGGASDQAGICRSRKTTGPCLEDNECATAHFCNATGSCERYHRAGEACTPGAGECYPALSFCDAGKCAGTLRANGEACGSIDGETVSCGEGYCAAETGAQGICVPETQPGEACTGSSLSECAGDNGHCDMTIGQCVSCDRN